MSNKCNLNGLKFNRLLVLKDTGKRKNRNILWLCLCDCGNEIETISASLRRGQTQSCGCLRIENSAKNHYIKHGFAKRKGGRFPRIYRIWTGMKRRCDSISHSEYQRYGGRGIKVCDEWKNSFINFMTWALSHGYQENLTIHRIDNDGNYEPYNCQWISRIENIQKR
jgi:hypothetical protein